MVLGSAAKDIAWQRLDQYFAREVREYLKQPKFRVPASFSLRQFRPGEIVHTDGGMYSAFATFLTQRGLRLWSTEKTGYISNNKPTKFCVILDRLGDGWYRVCFLTTVGGTVAPNPENPLLWLYSIAVHPCNPWPPGVRPLRTYPLKTPSFVVGLPVLTKTLRPLHNTNKRVHLTSGELERLRAFVREKLEYFNVHTFATRKQAVIQQIQSIQSRRIWKTTILKAPEMIDNAPRLRPPPNKPKRRFGRLFNDDPRTAGAVPKYRITPTRNEMPLSSPAKSPFVEVPPPHYLQWVIRHEWLDHLHKTVLVEGLAMPALAKLVLPTVGYG
ncbi:hypothetical protein BD410DRAFT_784185 [Rickenella mellea]|uniref:Uncharacterized protein n=1 Tax=Rickenella mellea TaxID=50990 RepID=A0A4Y7QEN9_9AGAM|nr:hypothetical protein BD410DRAFT_784185 [Rickenella mellea]